MDVRKDLYYAALTGDAIRSSKLEAAVRGRLHEEILEVGEELGKFFPGLLVYGINIFRGDSVQFLLKDPAAALRTALFFRAALKAASGPFRIDMRFAIGVGTADFLPEGVQGGADGEAYGLSGPALDAMSPRQSLRLAMPSDWATPSCREALKATVALTGTLAERWTEKQALAVKGALLGYTQDEIRKLWPTPVSRQAVAKNLDAAAWFAVEKALRCFEHFEFKTG